VRWIVQLLTALDGMHDYGSAHVRAIDGAVRGRPVMWVPLMHCCRKEKRNSPDRKRSVEDS